MSNPEQQLFVSFRAVVDAKDDSKLWIQHPKPVFSPDDLGVSREIFNQLTGALDQGPRGLGIAIARLTAQEREKFLASLTQASELLLADTEVTSS